MIFERQRLPVLRIVEGWRSGSLVRNPDYQRGEAWRTSQKQALIDSIFREYPIPPIFLEKKISQGLFGGGSEKFEIIDGQQRILALDGFFSDGFELLRPGDATLRLPLSLRAREASWSGRRFSELDRELSQKFEQTELDVFLVESVQHEDEVRDLFIRLQSGTALTRQQIRDAWPGRIGPLIETFAGKLDKQPRYRIFQAVDGRGTRDEEGDPRDRFVKHRQTCAQLMRILIARMSDPRHFPSVEAADVDGFYHENTSLDPAGPAVQELERIFQQTQKVTELLREQCKGRKKLPKLSLFALAFFFQDMGTNPYFRFNDDAASRLVEYVANAPIPAQRRTVSGPAVKAFYEAWLAGIPDGVGILLDPKRLFDARDREAIRSRDGGNCGVCGKPVPETEAEYDHHPQPHYLGGRTVPDNGRLVHAQCHPRGRPLATPADQ